MQDKNSNLASSLTLKKIDLDSELIASLFWHASKNADSSNIVTKIEKLKDHYNNFFGFITEVPWIIKTKKEVLQSIHLKLFLHVLKLKD